MGRGARRARRERQEAAVVRVGVHSIFNEKLLRASA